MTTDMDRPLGRVIRPVVWAQPDEPIRDVAQRLDATTESCVLVAIDRRLGIVTDHDFRRSVATGRVGPDAPVAEIASLPAVTIDEHALGAQALLLMVEHGCHHLVVTSTGDPVGVVRAVDLAQSEVREPLHLRSAIDATLTVAALAEQSRAIRRTLVELHANGLPARHIGFIHTALIEAVLRRVLALRADPALQGVAWLFLGSLARREPLPSSDVDTALLWADPPEDQLDPGDAIRTSAAAVLAALRHCGLSPCPNGANADNPLFSRSQSGWAEAAHSWLNDSTMDGALLLSAMVADSRPVTESDLGRHVTDQLMTHTRSSQFLRALLDEAVRLRTSTGMFRDFLVGRVGAHRGTFDLKRGGLVPIVALGRWIAIVTSDGRGTTSERLARGVEAGLITEDERHTLQVGFDNVYTILYDLEVQAVRGGSTPTTYVNPRHLHTLTRRHLRETLRAVHAVQTRVDQSWIRRLDG
jgi:CBS domain-containing protein